MSIAKPILAALIAAAPLASLPSFAESAESRSAGQFIDDKATSARVKAALFDSPAVRSSDVQVETYRGVVQLSGFVDSRQEADAAIAVARKIPGVQSVINSIQLKPEGQ